jgi:predicted unusual protein kinase regulating ubiquinone biosynthesis (AarF/ABC1/UbiB family)
MSRRPRVLTALTRGVQLAGLSADLMRARTKGADAAVRQRIIERLGAMHGLPQKIGQVISLGELDADEPTDVAYSALTESGAALPIEQIQPLVEEALGASLAERFQFFSPVGISASIGQVHRATLLDGRSVAVKVQYPGIGDAMGLDLGALEWLTIPFGGFGRGFDMAAYRGEVGAMLASELDYAREGATLRRLERLPERIPGLELPALIPELSTPTVLTMSWVAGDAFPETRQWSAAQRADTLRILAQFFLESVFQARLLHADPHAGNYRFRLDNGAVRVGVIDFGCAKALPIDFTDALARLFRLAMTGDTTADSYLACYIDLGFRAELMEPMADRLGAFTALMLEPWLSSEPFNFDAWQLGPRMAEVLGEFRWNLRVSGPANAIFVVRAWQGLLSYARALHAPVALRPMLDAMLGDLLGDDAPLMTTASSPVRAAVRTSVMTRDMIDPRTHAIAQHLKIRVSERGTPRVTLTFPGRCADTLEELMPDDLRARLVREGTNLAGIVGMSAKRGHVPGVLFESHHEQQHVRVWLE